VSAPAVPNYPAPLAPTPKSVAPSPLWNRLSPSGERILRDVAEHWTNSAGTAENRLDQNDVDVIQTATESNDLEACFLLGLCVRRGMIKAQKTDWIATAAKKGHPHALCLAAEAKEAEDAIPLLEEAAKLGEAVAQRRLGLYFLHTADDFNKAFVWLSRAALQEDPESLWWRGTCYKNSFGTPGNQSLGEKCQRRARELGYQPD
jgi:TPR repeat protein